MRHYRYVGDQEMLMQMWQHLEEKRAAIGVHPFVVLR